MGIWIYRCGAYKESNYVRDVEFGEDTCDYCNALELSEDKLSEKLPHLSQAQQQIFQAINRRINEIDKILIAHFKQGGD